MNKHTPGPWTTGSNGETSKGLAICAGPHVVAKVYGNGYPAGTGYHPESTANAHLIAAAPELLALVQAFANSADEEECVYCADESWHGEGHTSACLVGCAQRLITKAKGRSNE